MIRIEESTRERWISFLAQAPGASIYEQPLFLDAYERPVRYWHCLSGDETIAGLAAIEDGRTAGRLPFQQYNGIVFAPDADMKPVTRIGRRYAATVAFAEHLMAAYEAVSLAHGGNVIDMRPFQWVNYHAAAAPKFAVGVNYTTLIDLSSPLDSSSYQTLRRRCLAKAERIGLTTAPSEDTDVLLELADATYARQGKSLGEGQRQVLARIAAALFRHGCGRMYVTSSDAGPLAVALFALHRSRAFYVIGGSDRENGESTAGSKVMADAFVDLRRDCGIEDVDLVGVNSPNRGAFKLSFGGSLSPYYVTTKDRRADA